MSVGKSGTAASLENQSCSGSGQRVEYRLWQRLPLTAPSKEGKSSGKRSNPISRSAEYRNSMQRGHQPILDLDSSTVTASSFTEFKSLSLN